MTHVYSDPRNNNWLIESFCEAMSLIMLERIASKWLINPGVIGLNWYSPNLEKYKALVIANYLTEIGIIEDEIRNFDLRKETMQLTTPINRKINFIVAYRIWKSYLRNPSLLKIIPYLHHTSSKEQLGDNEHFEEVNPDISKFEKTLPIDLRRVWDEFKTEIV